MSVALWASVIALAVSLWSVWFAWHLRQTGDPESRTYERQLSRMMWRQGGNK